MNDDAKFFFFLSGFAGFVFFYAFSFFLNRDPILSLIYGSSGSLIFSLLGRALLISALRKIQLSTQSSGSSGEAKSIELSKNASGAKEKSALHSSLSANQEAASNKPKNLKSLSGKK